MNARAQGRAVALALGCAAVLGLGGVGCSTEPAGNGEFCTRSAQCEPGLACVEGECSGDIDAIGEQSQVPVLPDDAADEDAGSR